MLINVAIFCTVLPNVIFVGYIMCVAKMLTVACVKHVLVIYFYFVVLHAEVDWYEE